MRFFKLIVGLHNFLKEHRNNIKKINHGNDPMLERTEYNTLVPETWT